MCVFTRDRAEILACEMERLGYTVRRNQLNADLTRNVAGLKVRSAPYASVLRGKTLIMIIRYEWISEESELL